MQTSIPGAAPRAASLSITKARRFVGGWFFVRCPNCRRLLRVDPQHGQRWMLIAAFALIGAAAIGGARGDEPAARVRRCRTVRLRAALRLGIRADAALAARGRHREEARGYKRLWAIARLPPSPRRRPLPSRSRACERRAPMIPRASPTPAIPFQSPGALHRARIRGGTGAVRAGNLRNARRDSDCGSVQDVSARCGFWHRHHRVCTGRRLGGRRDGRHLGVADHSAIVWTKSFASCSFSISSATTCF
jgi:hypothetical protein